MLRFSLLFLAILCAITVARASHAGAPLPWEDPLIPFLKEHFAQTSSPLPLCLNLTTLSHLVERSYLLLVNSLFNEKRGHDRTNLLGSCGCAAIYSRELHDGIPAGLAVL